MDVTVNGKAVSAAAVDQAAAGFAGSTDPAVAAARMQAMRELLLDRARALGIATDDEPAAIEAVLDGEVKVPTATDDECRRYYDQHRALFLAGELAFARHILFTVSPGGPIDDVRRQAERTLKEVVAHPERFGDIAAKFSNCPSGADGGNLGQLARGDSTPEFAQAVFGSGVSGVLPELVRTRHGFHVVAVDRREPGRLLPFEVVRDAIALRLESRAQERALAQYVRVLASGADGRDSNATASPLVQ